MEHVVTAAVGVRERRLEDEGENDRERRKRMRRRCGRTTKIETGSARFIGRSTMRAKEAREYLVNGEVADRERAYLFCLRERRILYKG